MPHQGTDSYVVGSLQLSPGIPPYFRPPLFGFPAASGAASWYAGLSFGSGGTAYTDGFANNGWYGPPWGSDCPTGCPDALSGGIVGLDDLDTRYWTYRMEWEPGPHGHLSWYYDSTFVWAMSASSFGAYSVCSERGGVKECSRTPARQIPEEPMSLVMNTAIGTWNGGQTALDGKHWPAKFWIDYVRVWQKDMHVGCDPPDYPTRKYIQNNHEWYGEPVSPSGYDTCPEVYPKSAYDNAVWIKARGDAARKVRSTTGQLESQLRDDTQSSDAVATRTRLFTNIFAGLSGVGESSTRTLSNDEAKHDSSKLHALLSSAAAVVAVGVVAAMLMARRPLAPGATRFEPTELEYEQLQR